jgi:hypothetical protein
VQKIEELSVLAKALNAGRTSVAAALAASAEAARPALPTAWAR